jgi:hypothetical protein
MTAHRTALPVVLMTGLCLFSINTTNAQVKSLERPFDPVVLRGTALEDLVGTPVEELFVFAYDSVSASWSEIPFQIDEYDATTGSFAVVDTETGMDGDDELVFMAKDAGDRAPTSWPEVPGSETTRYEVEIETEGEKAWVYVFTSDQYELTQPVEDYVAYQAPVMGAADDVVTGKTYVVGNSENGLPVDLTIPEAAAGTNVDILSGLQLRLVGEIKVGGLITIPLSADESNFVAQGVEHVDGNLRVIREILLAIELEGTEIFSDIRLPVSYFAYSYVTSGNFDIPTEISTPIGNVEIKEVRQSFNLNDAATGMKMYNKRASEGVTIDGNSDTVDKTIDAGEEAWLLFTGAQGNFVNIFNVPSIGDSQELYYNDFFITQEYGNAGFQVTGSDIEGETPLGLKSVFPGEIQEGDEMTLGEHLVAPIQVTTTSQSYGEVTSVRQIASGAATPSTFQLDQNFPNPFNPETEITYHLPEQQEISLIVFNLIGQQVKTLVNTSQAAGSYSVAWDGTDRFGSKVPTGVYIYRLQAGKFVESRKMMLVK